MDTRSGFKKRSNRRYGVLRKQEEGNDRETKGTIPEGASRESLIERLEYELNVIRSMGYVDYFLIVWESTSA